MSTSIHSRFLHVRGRLISYSRFMIIDSRIMESVEDEEQLGADSEEEDSELSDDEVSEVLSC